eukprot:15474972-Alexandrium_andersonii.AAC.1
MQSPSTNQEGTLAACIARRRTTSPKCATCAPASSILVANSTGSKAVALRCSTPGGKPASCW